MNITKNFGVSQFANGEPKIAAASSNAIPLFVKKPKLIPMCLKARYKRISGHAGSEFRDVPRAPWGLQGLGKVRASILQLQNAGRYNVVSLSYSGTCQKNAKNILTGY